MAEQTTFEVEVGQLTGLPRGELVARWAKIYRCPPPKGIKRGLIERAIAWHIQASHLGGQSPKVQRQLNKLAALPRLGQSMGTKYENQLISPVRSSRLCRPEAGTRLIREWHGQSHIVDVTEEGFLFEGKTYSSLSAIAREITGARWSGPRFFGL